MKKRANKYVFDILKSLVDSKVPALNKTVSEGKKAAERVSDLQKQIGSAQQYICTNRYDRADTLETMSEISDYENEISRLKPICTKANLASNELYAAKNFYKIYEDVKTDYKIEELRREYYALEDRIDRLDDLMFSCEVNMNPFERSFEICDQASRDMAKYREEYDRLMGRVHEITKEINLIKGR